MVRGTLKVRGVAPSKIPSGVIALGFVSLFMDMSSELIHSLLPYFVMTTLHASPLVLGAIEGFTEAVASFAKLVSGMLSDRFQKRKPLLIVGYGLAALCKPLFALAPHAALVLIAKSIDRIGKGIRGAPRDALLADIIFLCVSHTRHEPPKNQR